MDIQAQSGLRAIADPPGITTARTLPAAWYADEAFFAGEARSVFRRGWICAGIVDDLPAPGAWRALTCGGLPILIVRDTDDGLGCFLNVCRHRGAPLCDDGAGDAGRLIRCPYHSWLYRLDGSLARTQGVGEPERFDPADHSLEPVGVTIWRRFVFVNLDDRAAPLDLAPLDLGPLADAISAFRIEDLELAVRETDDRAFNWKVLLENYSENYHTPFVHPEIDTSSSEDYPMVSDGPVLYAWDRPIRPGPGSDEQLRATLLPGEPGWERLADADPDGPYGVGSYLTIWPNLMLNVFPDAMLAMWVEPLTAAATRVERRLFVSGAAPPAARQRTIDSHRLVHDQDVAICTRVQRTHSAGVDVDGRLATVEERGVHFIHEHLRRAMG